MTNNHRLETAVYVTVLQNDLFIFHLKPTISATIQLAHTDHSKMNQWAAN